MDPYVIAAAAKMGNVIESVLAALRPGRDGPTAKALRVIPYRSIGDPMRLSVRGRVVRQAPTNPRRLARKGAVTTREHLAALYRAFDAIEVPFAQVEARCGSVCSRTTCDAGGFFVVELSAPRGGEWAAGRHHAHVHVADLGPTATSIDHAATPSDEATVDVFVPGAHSTLAIVSDLDDTAMDTNTVNTLSAVRTVLLRSAKRRHPVPGVSSLYIALRDGPGGDDANPVCYISSGAWNLYDVVLDYLDTHGLPAGAILLNDWGSRERTFHPVGHAHKSAHVTSLMARLPSLPFLLIGDDVQEDPELYAAVAREHPGRVPAIWIREVRGGDDRHERMERLRAGLAQVGTDLVTAEDTATFAVDAARRGWLPHELAAQWPRLAIGES